MSTPTILLVEDNEDNSTVYSLFLRYHGFRVIEARGGREALAAVEVETPDLVLMDISMPDIDGFEVTRLLKAAPGTALVPVIAVTAHTAPEFRERAYRAGCDGYVSKPCEPSRLLQVVRQHLAAVATSNG